MTTPIEYVYVPVDNIEFGKEIEKDGAINLVGGRNLAGEPRWLKRVPITELVELIERLHQLQPYHISPYNLGEEGEISRTLTKLLILSNQLFKSKQTSSK